MESAALAALLVGSFIMAAPCEDRGIDKYMINFEPYRSRTNPKHDYDSQTLVYLKGGTVYNQRRRDNFCDRINEWLSKYLQSVIEEVGTASSIVLLTVPRTPKGFAAKRIYARHNS